MLILPIGVEEKSLARQKQWWGHWETGAARQNRGPRREQLFAAEWERVAA